MSKTSLTKNPAWIAIDPKEVLVVVGGKIYLFGQEITKIELQNLKTEVQVLKSTRLWVIMQETLRQKAVEKGFILSTNWEEALSGKMMLHSLGIVKSILDVIDSYTQAGTPKK